MFARIGSRQDTPEVAAFRVYYRLSRARPCGQYPCRQARSANMCNCAFPMVAGTQVTTVQTCRLP